MAASPDPGELTHDHTMLGAALAYMARAIGEIVDDRLKLFCFLVDEGADNRSSAVTVTPDGPTSLTPTAWFHWDATTNHERPW